MSKLYYVELIQRMFVTAAFEEEAISEAKYYASKEDYIEEYAQEATVDHLKAKPDWKGCWPYGIDDDNRTVEEWLESPLVKEAVS